MRSYFLLLLFFITGCQRLPVADYRPAVCSFAAPEPLPLLVDDFTDESLNKALTGSIAYLEGQDLATLVMACGRQYSGADLLKTLTDFKDMLQNTPAADLPGQLADNFELCQALNSQGKRDILVTGYYQPRLRASKVRSPPFVYPLYKLPPDLIVAKLHAETVTTLIGRQQNGRLVPYWSRAEIDDADPLKGAELIYLADPFDVFTLHIQGSGLVEFEDGSVKQVLYAGSNGRPYRSIGRLLVDEGKIPLAEINMPAIKYYLHEHLDERRRILHYNKRYIFFRLADVASGPIGSMGEPLTAKRSVALDPECFSPGGLYFLKTEMADIVSGEFTGWQPFSRFVLHQDSGAAIKGSGRLDLFMGTGANAGRAAGLMKQPGELFMLMKK